MLNSPMAEDDMRSAGTRISPSRVRLCAPSCAGLGHHAAIAMAVVACVKPVAWTVTADEGWYRTVRRSWTSTASGAANKSSASGSPLSKVM